VVNGAGDRVNRKAEVAIKGTLQRMLNLKPSAITFSRMG